MDCDWNNPGVAPYRGLPVESALLAYSDLTDAQRNEIRWKIDTMNADAVIFIRKDGISSAFGEAKNLRDMHWKGGLCEGKIDRKNWSSDHEESALVYCSGQQCVAVPVVCGNISRVDYRPFAKPDVELKFYEGQVNKVPEPSTLVLVFGAILFLITRKKVVDNGKEQA